MSKRKLLSRMFRLIVALGCAAVVCACTSVQPHAAPRTLRVMTWNIHHGEGLDGKVDLHRIAALITHHRADVVALQEVDKGVDRTDRRDMPAELAAMTGMTCLFDNNFRFQGGQYGNAVLTRLPVVEWSNHHYKMLREGEQRGLFHATLDVHGRRIVFMNTHIDARPDDAERWSNVGEIEGLLKQYGGLPVILCGDFNDRPRSRVCRRLAESFGDAWARVGEGDGLTYASGNPRSRIDYIWVSKGSPLVPRRSAVFPSDASDHMPLVVEIEMEQ